MSHLFMKSIFQYGISLFFIFSLVAFSCLSHADESLDYEKALAAFENKDYSESYIHVRNSLQKNGDYLPAKVLVGRLFLRNGLYEQAEIEFSEALQLGVDLNLIVEYWGRSLLGLRQYQHIVDFNYKGKLYPQKLDIWLQYRGEACVELKDYDCAEQSYTQLIKNEANAVNGLTGLASLEIRRANFDKASEYVNEAIIKAPNNPIVIAMKGQLFRKQGRLNESLEYLTRAAKLAPDNSIITKQLVDAYIAASDFEAANNATERMLSDSPDDTFLLFASSWLSKQLKSFKESEKKLNDVAYLLSNVPNEIFEHEPSLLYLRGMVAFLRQQYETAQTDFTSYATLSEGNIQAIVLLARTLIELDDNKSALQLLEKHESKLDTDVGYALLLGGLYIEQNKNYKAVALLERLEKLFPNNIDVALFSSRLLVERGKIQDGFRLLDKLVLANPKSRTVLLAHSVANMQANRFAVARNSLDTLLELYPEDIGILNAKAGLLILQGQLIEANQLLNRVLTVNSGLFSARFNQANILYGVKDYEKGIDEVNKLLSERPDHVRSNLLKAKLLTAIEQNELALDLYRQLLTKNRDSVIVNNQAVDAFINHGYYDESIAILKRLNKLDSSNPRHYVRLAQVFIRTADNSAAKREILKLGEIGKNTPSALAAQSQLWLALKDNENALLSIQKAYDLAPDTLRYGVSFVSLLISNNALTKAEKALRKLVKKYPDNLQLKFKRAELANAKQEHSVAFNLYVEILKAHPNNDLALAKLYALVTIGQSQDTFLAIINKIVNTFPERYFPRSLLAQYHYYYGSPAIAIEHYEHIVTQGSAPNKYALNNRLAELYLDSDLGKSEFYANAAYALNTSDWKVLSTYGWVLARQNKFEQSLPLLRSAYSRNSTDLTIVYRLSFVLHNIGRNTEAKNVLKQVVNIDSTNPTLLKIKELYLKVTS